MTEDRRTKEDVTPGEDPREIDAERTQPEAVRETQNVEAVVNPQQRHSNLGASSDKPGRDLEDLEDSPDVPLHREPEE